MWLKAGEVVINWRCALVTKTGGDLQRATRRSFFSNGIPQPECFTGQDATGQVRVVVS